MSHRVESSGTLRYWTASKVFGAAFLWFFAVAFITGAVQNYADEGEPWSLTLGIFFSAIGFSAPFVGYALRRRPESIRAPRVGNHDGTPAVLFPADRPAVPVSAALYLMLSGLLVSWGMVPGTNEARPVAWTFFALAALFFSYTLFAISGRFHDDGTYLHERGVTIRARGLRAELPWTSIAGSRTYKTWPFPYPRIAIDLVPGTPREVSTTVPWWLGSPRPRKNTVFLTTVQVPAFERSRPNTNPGTWIEAFTQQPAPREYWGSLIDPPSLHEARHQAWKL